MTKSLEFDFLGLYKAVLTDVALYHPEDQLEWDRDFSTLTRLYRDRGMSIFTMDLPAIGKQLDKSLSKGVLCLEGPLTRSRSHKVKSPKLFSGIWRRIFTDDGVLNVDTDPNDVLFLRTLLYVGKNLKWECAPKYLFEAITEFFNVESAIAPPSHLWDGTDDFPVHATCHLHDLDRDGSSQIMFQPDKVGPCGALLDNVQRIADIISAELGFFDPRSTKFRHGPGAVSDLSTGSYKYSFPTWGRRAESIFPFDEFGSTGLDLMDRLQQPAVPSGAHPDLFRDAPIGVESEIGITYTETPSKLVAVPKTQKGPRLIASEPTCHQWLQQGILHFLYSRVEHTLARGRIVFNDQTVNREGARLGSLDGSLATIDLKSASDRISCHLVERIFRRNPGLLKAMAVVRTRYMINNLDKKHPNLIKIRKFTTQGSALTFPVQSLVFYCIALGVGKTHEPNSSWRKLSRKVRVFGDDIIVPKTWVEDVILALTTLGLRVNHTKTHFEGNFRESCGMDAWKGYDVTPPYVTQVYDGSKPDSVASNVAVSNNFHKKGFWNAARWIMTSVTRKQIPVINGKSGQFGFVTFSDSDLSPHKRRWNPALQIWERRVLAVIAKAKRVKQDSAAALLQYFTEEPSPYILYESGVAVAGVPVFKHAWVGEGLLGSTE